MFNHFINVLHFLQSHCVVGIPVMNSQRVIQYSHLQHQQGSIMFLK